MELHHTLQDMCWNGWEKRSAEKWSHLKLIEYGPHIPQI